MFSSGENRARATLVRRSRTGEQFRGEKRAIAGYLSVRWTLIALLVLPAVTVGVWAQSKASPSRTKAETKVTVGKRAFAARCAGCHGLDGRGGQRAPNIATSPTAKHWSDPELARVITKGRTDFGMPAFREIGQAKIQQLVDYLRVLQGKRAVAAVAGNPRQGKDIFFGKAACSSCHTIAGQGGFVGSDLSTYARGLTPAEIRKAITDPAPSTGRARTAVATARDGQMLGGMVRNEDNFSVQIQSEDGVFHFLLKSDLEKLERQPLPPMPSDYGQRLARQELDDLVGYLQSIKAESLSEPAEEQPEY